MSTAISSASARLKTESGQSLKNSQLKSQGSFSSRDFKRALKTHSKIDSSMRRVESQQRQLLSLREAHLQLLPTFLNISEDNSQRLSMLISAITKEDDADKMRLEERSEDLKAVGQQRLQREMYSHLNTFKSKLNGVWAKVSDNNEKYLRYLTNRLQMLTEEAKLKVEAIQGRSLQEVGDINRKFRNSYQEIASPLISKAFISTFKPQFNSLESKLGMLFNELCFAKKGSNIFSEQSPQDAQLLLLHQNESLKKRIELLRLKHEQLHVETEKVAKKLARKTKITESVRMRAILNKMEADRLKNRQHLDGCHARQVHLARQKRFIDVDSKGLQWMEEQLGVSEWKEDIDKSNQKVKARNAGLLEQLNFLSTTIAEKIGSMQIE